MWSTVFKKFHKCLIGHPGQNERFINTFLLSSRVPLLKICDRNDFTSRNLSDYSSHIHGKYMQKLLNKRGAKTKRKWYQPHLAEPLEPIGTKPKSPKKSVVVTEVQRTRARQLGHVLYDRITHILGTGELSQDIQDKQVFITEVKMHPNFGGINVFWEAGRADAHEVEKLLQGQAGKLRSLLISYHVLGKIPPIYFVRSKGRHYTEDIDKLLEIADYGPDYEPSDSVLRARRKRETGENLTSQTESSVKTMNITQINFLTNSDSSLVGDPKFVDNSGMDDLKFRNNLYGLPVEDLLKKIHAKKNKVRGAGDDMGSVLDVFSEEERSRQISTITKSVVKRGRFKESSKIKQTRLERDPDFRIMNRRFGSETVEEDYDER